MNRVFLTTVLLASATLASGQSLGDVARAAKANKQRTATNSPRVVTNDSLSLLQGKMTEASGPAATSPAEPGPATTDQAAAPKPPSAEPAKDEAAQAEEKKKAIVEEINKTKAEIEQLSRELDVAQRENRLRAATYYADAGNRLRNEAKYAEDDRRYQQEIQNKQKAIDDAKQKLESLREQARRMGVNAS